METTIPTTESDDVIWLKEDEERLPLEGLYLKQHLAGLALALGRPLVLTAYVTDRNGIVAKRNEKGKLAVPPEVKNRSDWRLFQELMAQADLVISSSAYMRSWMASGGAAQDILFQYEAGQPFEHLGEWRLSAGFERRSPDVAVVCHHIDFKFPEKLFGSGRRLFVFTTTAGAASPEAEAMRREGVEVVGGGEMGVDGRLMVDFLSNDWGYNVLMMATGPAVLDLLLRADRMDLIYVCEAQVELDCNNLGEVRTILPSARKIGSLTEYKLAYRYLQQRVRTDAGALISQLFLRYDRRGIFEQG